MTPLGEISVAFVASTADSRGALAVQVGLHRGRGAGEASFVIGLPELLLCTRLRVTWRPCPLLGFELPQSPAVTVPREVRLHFAHTHALPFLALLAF